MFKIDLEYLRLINKQKKLKLRSNINKIKQNGKLRKSILLSPKLFIHTSTRFKVEIFFFLFLKLQTFLYINKST